MRFRARSRRRRPGILIVPLIDILLALLLFLLVSSSFTKAPAIQLTLPEAETGAPVETTLDTMLITVSSEEPRYYVGQDAVSVEALESQLTDWARAQRGGVVVRADDAAAFGAVIRILDWAKALGIQPVSAVVERPQDAP